MLLRQRAEGRCEVENQYTRVVRPEGNARALAAIDETMELRDDFEWRGLGTIPRSALRLRPAFAAWDAEELYAVPGRAHRGPEGVSLRRGADGPDQAVGVRRLRHGVHARAPARYVHGLERGSVRRVLRLRPSPPSRGARLASRPRRRLRDELITLAHGAGGKATRDLVEALFLEELGNEALAALGRRRRRRGSGSARALDRLVRRAPAGVPRRRYRRARGERHRQRPRDGRAPGHCG